MSVSHLNEMQTDHKHWLQEIQRWQAYLETWREQQSGLRDAVTTLADRVDDYVRDLDSLAADLERHRGEILSCERAMVERRSCGPEELALELAAEHSRSASHHHQLRSIQERLHELHHRIVAQLAASGHSSAVDAKRRS